MAAVDTAANKANNIKQPTAMVSRRSTSVNMRAALAYAQKLGWAVVPLHSIVNGRCSCGNLDCKNPGKHPRYEKGVIEHGFKDATTDTATITRWWKKWPNANIGLPCRLNGVFVIDVDARHGGVDSLYQLIAEYGELPHTVTANSGGGGAHFYFKHPDNLEIIDKQGFRPGLDVKDKGYVVLPPSNHISGNRYAWRKECHPLTTSIADAPQWLLELISSTQGTEDAGAKPPDEWAKMLDELDEGKRNDSLYRYACHLLAHGLSAVETVKLVRALNKTYGRPPLPDAEVDKLLQSAIDWRFGE